MRAIIPNREPEQPLCEVSIGWILIKLGRESHT